MTDRLNTSRGPLASGRALVEREIAPQSRAVISTYALISPVRSEASNLARLADCVEAQTVMPACWIIVDNGSTDETPALIAELERRYRWVRGTTVPGADRPRPGSPVVRAFHTGLTLLPTPWPDIVVKLDADTSFERDHFERILLAFESDSSLGIAGGTCLEERRGSWVPTYVTSNHVRGAVRAYRRECLNDVLPLEDGMGWDGIDELKAQSRGWSTHTVSGVWFRHHRAVGARDGRGYRRRIAEGRGAHYMRYRPTYLLCRSLWQTRRDPWAFAMVLGYLDSALRRKPTLEDPSAVRYLRDKQRLRALRERGREARGKHRSAAES